MSEQQYVIQPPELHLFSGRIMKEHALFLQAGFTPRDAGFSREAAQFLSQFEAQLQNAVRLSEYDEGGEYSIGDNSAWSEPGNSQIYSWQITRIVSPSSIMKGNRNERNA
jgi:hypothetical protein